MTDALFAQTIEYAFEEAVGVRGANVRRFHQLCEELTGAIPDLFTKPQREAAPMLALPSRTDDLPEIESLAAELAGAFSDIVVVGMGGSSLSAETLAYLRHSTAPKLHYIDNIGVTATTRLIERLPWASTAFFVVSKSGNTVETHAQMAILLREAKARIGTSYAKHFTIVTITNDNPLHRLAREHGMRLLAHDPDLGGRFSILSGVGLIPAAAAGIDIRALRAGAQAVIEANRATSTMGDAASMAALNLALIEKGSNIHVLMHYADRLMGLATWYRQCWAESLGKDGKGCTMIPSRGATDQHGQLQLYLEGPKDKFFTAIIVDAHGKGGSLNLDSADDRLSYLSNHTLGDLVMAEQQGTNVTLTAYGCPLRTLHFPVLDATRFGALLMHMMLEIMFTAHMLKVNAFDQPAVEASKKRALAYLSGQR